MSGRIPLEKVRNIGIIAHFDAGKTTTTERLLYCAGRIRKIGEVSAGEATMDWMPQERERGITITAAATFCKWQDCHINIIDTPGHVEFTAEVERALRVLDGAVACFDAALGVEPQSETVWHQADKYRVPRVVYINKMDRMGADFDMSCQSIIKMLGANAVPIQLPIGTGSNFVGLIDLIKMKARIWKGVQIGTEWDETEIPAEMRELAARSRKSLIEKVIELDAALKQRQPDSLSADELRGALRSGVLQARIFPVLCGSSVKNIGVQSLLDAICDFLPSPSDRPPVKGISPDEGGREIVRIASDDEPFSALMFKIQTDPFVGKLIFFRVYSGTLRAGDVVMFGNNRSTERIGRILRMHANQREEIKAVYTGDIAATVALKNGRVGYTMCDQNSPIVLEQIIFPEPVISVVIEPKTKADEEKLANAMLRLAEEDQTFRIKTDVETGQTIISGMGELHLDIIVDRMKREFKVEANVGSPQVAYRETVRKKVREEGKFIRQSGGRSQYAHVVLEIEPQPQGKRGFVFVNEVSPDRIPHQFIPAVENGVREALEGGALAGFPIMDIRVSLVAGSHHEADSSEMAFKIAGAMALRSGCKKADPTLLEPIMKCEATTPEQYAGDVIGDLNSRRAKIQEMGDRGGLKFVRCTVPLSEMFGYATVLRSISHGRASFTMEPSDYEEVPWDIYKASIDPHGPDEPPTASAGRPVRPIRPKPGLSGGARKPFPPEPN